MTRACGARGDASLAGKVALVTGAAGGIGAAVVGMLLETGAEVIGTDLVMPREWSGSMWVDADLTCIEAVEALCASIAARGRGLDILVHCAGITRDGMLWKLSPERWSEVMAVNLDSAFYLLRFATPLLRASAGTVVLLSSINGERGKLGQSNYAASKAGLIALAKTAARELGRFGVRVNSVLPGLVQTPMTESLPPAVLQASLDESPLGRVAQPGDVANLVWFLCSDLSGHITGQSLRVDGGQLIV
ncbi:MAG: SDR family oxidoreductase [Nannocystaceae bacterium]